MGNSIIFYLIIFYSLFFYSNLTLPHLFSFNLEFCAILLLYFSAIFTLPVYFARLLSVLFYFYPFYYFLFQLTWCNPFYSILFYSCIFCHIDLYFWQHLIYSDPNKYFHFCCILLIYSNQFYYILVAICFSCGDCDAGWCYKTHCICTHSRRCRRCSSDRGHHRGRYL